MKDLTRFELRKLLERPIIWGGLLLVLLFSLFLSYSSYRNMYAFDPILHMEGSGKTAVEINKAAAARYEGILTDEKVQQMLSDLAPKTRPGGINAICLGINAVWSAAAPRFSTPEGSWNGTAVSDIYGDEIIKIGYVDGWLTTSSNIVRIFIVLSFVLILAVSPIFSGEYNGVDNLILTARYGRSKCAAAKIAASLITAAGVFLVIAGANLLFAFLLYGKEGLDCSILFAPLEFVEKFIPFNITVGELLCYQILLGFANMISVTGIALALSALSKNQLAAFAVCAALYVLPILIPVSETSGFFRILALLPLFYVQFVSLMSIEQIGSGLLYAVWALPVSILFIVMGGFVSYKAFAKHQVF